MKANRNLTLSVFQGIGCLCVILVHFPMKNMLGGILSSTGLIAVLLFFLTSGWYSYDEKPHKKIKMHLKKNVGLTIRAICLYALYTIIVEYCSGRLGEWMEFVMRLKVVPQVLIFGSLDLINGSHLWFLVAIVWAYLIMYIIEKREMWGVVYKMLPIAILFRVVVEIITNSTAISWHWSGNFLVGALPLMLLGHFFAERQVQNKISTMYIVAMIAFGGAFNYTMTFIRPFNINFSQIGKVVAACGLFLYAMKFPSELDNRFFGFVGEKLSKHIYVLHVLVGLVLLKLISDEGISESAFFPLLVAIATIAVSCIIEKIKWLWRRRKID